MTKTVSTSTQSESSENGNNKITLLRPVPIEFKISSPYGWRVINGKKEFHKGYDFAVPVGTRIVACHDGAAFRCGWENPDDHNQGYGLRIWQEIQVDGKRAFLWYGHTSKILIKEGDRIKRGQEIAFSGNTGRSTGAHLHLGARHLDAKEFLEIEFLLA